MQVQHCHSSIGSTGIDDSGWQQDVVLFALCKLNFQNVPFVVNFFLWYIRFPELFRIQTDNIIRTSHTKDIIFYLQGNDIFDCVFFHTQDPSKMFFGKRSMSML